MKTVGLVGAWNRNLGDLAILEGMKDVLGLDDFRELAMYDCQALDCSHAVFRAEDALIVGAGGLLWDKPELDSPSGWQWQTSVEAIEALRVPLIVYGIGWTQFPYNDDTGQHPQFAPTLRAAFEKAELFSVRNDYTRRKLKETVGINPEVILDPAFHLRPADESPIYFKEPPVGVVWASDKPHMRWRSDAEQEDAMRWLVTELRQENAPVLLIQHIRGLDDGILEVLRTHLDVPVLSLEELAPEVYDRMDPRAVLSVYCGLRKVYSMRKHGIILGIRAGKPVRVIPGAVEEVDHIRRMVWGPETIGHTPDTDDFNRRVREVLAR